MGFIFMRRGILAFAFSLFLTSCAHETQSGLVSRFHDDGRAKPIVAVVPVFDRSGAGVPWNLSEELTSAIEKRLSKRSNIYLIDDEKVQSVTSFLNENHNPFGKTLSWMKSAFKGNEFVVFMELVTHQLTAHENAEILDEKEDSSYTLDLKMRLRIVDLRDAEPVIILQELMSQSHYIPKLLAFIDYTKNGWGKMSYNVTPYGLSHAQFTREISKRLEDYILLAKSK